MEELLNKLIEKGWKPFGKRNKLYAVEDGIYILGRIASDWNTYDLRQIVSKESWLWQFCVENKMVKEDEDYSREKYRYNHWMLEEYKSRVLMWEARKYQVDYEYRIIESALKDESELEDFLLQSIKING